MRPKSWRTSRARAGNQLSLDRLGNPHGLKVLPVGSVRCATQLICLDRTNVSWRRRRDATFCSMRASTTSSGTPLKSSQPESIASSGFRELANKKLVASAVDLRNQSTFVVADVEDNACPKAVGVLATLFYKFTEQARPFGFCLPRV